MPIPEGHVATRRSPEFTQDTIPPALRQAHETTHDTWAVIHVLEGRLRYCTISPASETVLEPGRPGEIEPEVKHRVEPLGAVRFYLEFHYPPERHPTPNA
ncbi:DUF1971 domain-containing protein [Roseomonas sp. HF4]|jgi:tellurite resistance-related uncharacterized protein|uniref:DUF1971 domain-containing protein n=1 Tax=Roseomonas sp. HF4 TaxID=2562313 RepID=UPI0010C127EA|nr:DUF1971 domain-containing protein [Roseomonas sp. HF4]